MQVRVVLLTFTGLGSDFETKPSKTRGRESSRRDCFSFHFFLFFFTPASHQTTPLLTVKCFYHLLGRVSSVLNRATREFGKQHLLDGNTDTCWNSDQVRSHTACTTVACLI
jgi:hypothetical protein